jgi:hypothetical protein
MLRALRWVLWTLVVGNWLGMLITMGVLLVLLIAGDDMTARLITKALPGHELTLRHIAAGLCVVGLGIAVCADIVLRRLLAIVETVARDQPFTPANARRLTHIAWAWLSMQVLGIGVAVLAASAAHHQGQPDLIDTDSSIPLPWTPGITGWLAVLLLFVLARVFAHGTRMQEEIEGTV